MATRYYLPSTGAPAVSPATDVNWSIQGPGDRIALVTTKISSALTNLSNVVDSDGGWGFRQYVSDPIGVVNFNGTTFSTVVRCLISNAGGNASKLNVVVKLYHSGGTFDYLLTMAEYGTNFSTTAMTKIVSAAALANISSQNNDRIVIEYGVNAVASFARTVTERFGDSNASDFALTAGLTTDLNPWAEFSATIPAASTRNSNFLSINKW